MHRDIPFTIQWTSRKEQCSLYAQGYTAHSSYFPAFLLMFPVCTGIYREIAQIMCGSEHVPCMHRDIPKTMREDVGVHRCSLYAQGYTAKKTYSPIFIEMFPVCTGIYRNLKCLILYLSNVPCMHRDIPWANILQSAN